MVTDSDLTTGYIHMRHGENPDQFRVTQDKEQEMASLFAESRTLRIRSQKYDFC